MRTFFDFKSPVWNSLRVKAILDSESKFNEFVEKLVARLVKKKARR